MTGDLVFEYPFVALESDSMAGLHLTWEGDRNHEYRSANKSQVPPDLGRALHWCWDCKKVQNQTRKGDDGCPCCGKPESWDVTFVSADPKDHRKRMYWPLGSIDSSKMKGPPEIITSLITDTLEVHREVAPLAAMELLKTQGVRTLADVEIISIHVGPEQVREEFQASTCFSG